MTTRPDTVAIVSVTFAVTALIAAFDPATTWWFPSCPLFVLTGWQCPLCGSLRALHALAAGSLGAALAFNPLTTVGALAGAAALAADLVRPVRVPRVDRLSRWCFSTRALAFVVVFGVCRHVPVLAGWFSR
jgi:hypothetical protein